MKMNFNPIRGLKTLAKCVICAGLVAFPAVWLVAPQSPASVVVTLGAGVTGVEIQQALDSLPDSGGEVVLASGVYELSRPIILQRSYQTLRGSGSTTVLHLADGANCPAIIMGEPVNHPQQIVRHLRVAGLFIDGNRSNQQRELWQLHGEGSQIRNNGITVQSVGDSIVENVTCARNRSGGLVTTLGVQRLTVRNLNAFDNEFDGLACYLTTDCLFTGLYLHDNPGAGISLDLAFAHNVISNAVLTGNDLGIFMRASRDNQFQDIAIRNSRHHGVFMADVEKLTKRGWESDPQTECVDNSFTNLMASNCGGAAFRVNDTTCTNNVIIQARFDENLQGGLSLAGPDLVTMR
jgi:polygalacturonase